MSCPTSRYPASVPSLCSTTPRRPVLLAVLRSLTAESVRPRPSPSADTRGCDAMSLDPALQPLALCPLSPLSPSSSRPCSVSSLTCGQLNACSPTPASLLSAAAHMSSVLLLLSGSATSLLPRASCCACCSWEVSSGWLETERRPILVTRRGSS